MTPERAFRRPIIRIVGLVALGAILSCVAWWPMFDAYPNTPEGDGRYFLHLFNVVKASVNRYHELPLWNPYECGGAPLWDNPESMAASPFLWLTMALSGTKTVYAWNVAHLTIGFVGMWLLCRREVQLSRMATFAAACIYTFGVANASQYAGAHAALISFLDAPLALFLWRGAETDTRKAVGLGLLVALMFMDGATYPIPHTALLLAADTLTRIGTRERAKRILRAGSIALPVALGVGAARVIPLFDQFTSKHRLIEADVDHLARWNSLWKMYMWREVHWWNRLPGQTYVWGEYDAYMGGIVMFCALVGLLLAGRKRVWLIALAAFTFVLMLGHFAPWAPWSFLHEHVFPFKSMRVSARFRLLFCMFIAAFVGVAMDRAPVLLGRVFGSSKNVARIARALVCGFAFLGAGDMMGVAGDLVASRFGGLPEHPIPTTPRLYYEGGGVAEYIDQPRQNRGRIACQDAWAFSSGAAVWGGDVPQARAKDKNAVVEVANRTQNTFTIDVVAEHPARILVNSGYERGWRTDVGEIGQENLLLVVDVPEGRHHIKLEYVPKGLYLGLAITVLSLLASIAFLARLGPFKDRAAGLVSRRD